ncbi:hypothetical protein V6N13_001867 [Hibiscus sabdariffa]|uniref:Uncharacterized protein n=1 Tax=Hibiscus sabdariffa TaxID=183260 RepID=A0ABR2G9G7_9ROSI
MPLMKLENLYDHHMIGLWALLQQSSTSTKTNHVSNTECLSVTIMLLLCQALRQGINNVVIRVYLSYSHISSDEMEALKSVFGSFDEIWVSLLMQSSIVATTEFYSIRYAGDNP